MGKYDHFILLNLYNIFIFMQLSLSVCHCFYKDIFNYLSLFLHEHWIKDHIREREREKYVFGFEIA